jgi:DNA (cytosine-5)-methyltransferase 1
MPNLVSLFSGVGGMDLGLDAAGYSPVQFCEIDDRAQSVLRRHWPGVPVHDDVTTLDLRSLRGSVSLVAGGSPCQDLSVAGRRKGLGGERSGLFWHQCRIADETTARWVLWENVLGALSSNDGHDFAAVLWGLTGLCPAVPEDGWRSTGVCCGPRRTAVWRVLDAQHFGVPQRRRRVFVVASAAVDDPVTVLLESTSLRGDAQTGRPTEHHVAATLAGGSGKRGWALDTERMTFIPTRAHSLSAEHGTRNDPTAQNFLPWSATEEEAAVRRLTPIECERLMGWPDDHTRWDDAGREITDGHRYRFCGNGVASPVAEWIGRRILNQDSGRTT